jgi:hypothetical protein
MIEQAESPWDERQMTPGERARGERALVEWRKVYHAFRDDPASFATPDFRLSVPLKDYRETATLPLAAQRVPFGVAVAFQIFANAARGIMRDPN